MKAWGGLSLALALSLIGGCGSNSSSSATITLSPTAATVLLGTSIQFIPNVAGSSNAIAWTVNGVANGNATVGTISPTGLYTAPVTRPVAPSPVAVPIVFTISNASVPGSGTTGAVIELQSGFDVSNFSPGNTINISGNSVAGWNGSFTIVFASPLQDGNFGVQIVTPAGTPASGTGGTAIATPNIIVTAQVTNTNAIATATISLDSGIRVAFAQPGCSIGTNEQFSFAPLVSVTGAPVANQTVTWTLTGVGTIDPNSGLYTAPAASGTATITATSTADTTESASATITVVTAADPALSSISPTNGALGAAFQDVYLTGSSFICTTGVFVNNVPLPPGNVSTISSTSLLVNVPDSILSTLPTTPGTPVTLTFTVERQGGAPQPCSPSPCQLQLSPVRPAVVSATPDSIPLPSSGTFNVTLDGGYFGTTNATAGVQGNPVVSVQFNGQTIATPTFNTDRRLVLAVPAADASVPGLYPITVANNVSGSQNGSMAAVNFAVEPTSIPTSPPPASVAVGTDPSSIAINTATGRAVVANQGSGDLTIINLATNTPVSICTDGSSGPCTVTAPASVAVDNVRNLALVANTGTNTLAVVDLSANTVTALVSFPSADPNGNAFTLTPQAVGINPVTGRALVAFTTRITGSGPGGSNIGAILDMNQLKTLTGSVSLPAALVGVVNLSNGLTPHIAVSTRLNWALATPGGAGALSIVDLNRQTISTITTLTRNGNVVVANTSATPSLQLGEPVLISGVANSSFDGIFAVTSVTNTGFQYVQIPPSGAPASSSGGTASYATPVVSIATDTNLRGVSINDETQKALFANPTTNVPAFVFDILDQSSALVQGLPSSSNNVATAMNPLTNVGFVLNSTSGQISVVDPVIPKVIGSFSGGSAPIDLAVDPGTNNLLVLNSGAAGSVGIFPLPSLRSAPQIIQSSFASSPSAPTSPRVTITSSLASAASVPNQIVTLVGKFTNTSVPRLDGDPSPFSGVTISNGRTLTATLSGTTLAANGPRHYALDVQDGSALSNVEGLQVIQAVSLVTGGCATPAPQGVAIDVFRNVAVVTEPGCNQVSMVNLAGGTGFGAAPELAVGPIPLGVDVYPQAGLAVTANGSGSVSIIDVANGAVPTSFTVDPIPAGVAIDVGTGQALVSASGASVLDVFPVSTAAQTFTPIGVQRGPTGVAIDPRSGTAVVANSSSNTVSVIDLATNSARTASGSIALPQGVAFDPVTDSFLITSSATNQVVVIDPNAVASTAIRVGVDPSSIAYNAQTGTLITANNLSGTVTVVDFIDRTVRGVFSLPSSTQFAVAIHPLTNLAVVADPVGNQLLLVPLPH